MEEYNEVKSHSHTVELCPCCGSAALVGERVDGATVHKVVMCDNRQDIGPRDSSDMEGCLLQLPPRDFYKLTIREAVEYWNDYARALTAVQRANRWKHHHATRDENSVRKAFEEAAIRSGVSPDALARWPAGDYVSPVIQQEWLIFRDTGVHRILTRYNPIGGTDG